MAKTARQKKPKGEVVLQAVRPNAGIEAAYRRKLLTLIDVMHVSVDYWIKAAYRKNEPVLAQDAADDLWRSLRRLEREWYYRYGMKRAVRQPLIDEILTNTAAADQWRRQASRLAQDETPAETLRKAVNKLKRQWFKRFDEASDDLAKWFAQSAAQRSTGQLKSILKKGGFAVEFRITPAVRDVMQASVAENVSLIKSIPERYFTNVESIVMTSVQAGRDLQVVTDELQKQYGVTKRRAAFISLDQNNKVTAAVTKARRTDLGLYEAIWIHSGGGREPRPSHVKAGREKARFDIRKGWYDPHEKRYIQPGELIRCRCVSRPVVKGFS